VGGSPAVQRYEAACAAWTATTGLSVHGLADGETWLRYSSRVGPPPGSAATMRARLCLPRLARSQ
jgi:hypothetical protein